MEHLEEITPDPIWLRLNSEQPLWLMWAEDGTYLAAGLEEGGPVLLSWTTRDEMDAGVRRLGYRAPDLFRVHRPIQRSVREAFETARRLGCRLWIDEYVVEGFLAPQTGDRAGE
jgi:hypothetical protein